MDDASFALDTAVRAAAAAAAAPPQPGSGPPRTGGPARLLRTPATAGARTPAGAGLLVDPVAFVTRTPGYEISPYRPSDEEDDDFDDEDDENTAPLAAGGGGGGGGSAQPAAAGKTTRRGKTIPAWARTKNLLPLLRDQAGVDPDSVFKAGGRRFATLDEIFEGWEGWSRLPGGQAPGTVAAVAAGAGGPAAAPPGPSLARREAFARRTSSGDWAADRVTRAEEAAYKRAMGFACDAPDT